MFISETNKEFKDMNISNNRTIDRAAKALIKEGWTYRQSKGGHVVLKDPKTGFSLPAPISPSCHRAEKNWLSAVKKIRQGVRP